MLGPGRPFTATGIIPRSHAIRPQTRFDKRAFLTACDWHHYDPLTQEEPPDGMVVVESPVSRRQEYVGNALHSLSKWHRHLRGALIYANDSHLSVAAAEAIEVPLRVTTVNTTVSAPTVAENFVTYNSVGPDVSISLNLEDKLRIMEAGSVGPLLATKDSVRRDPAKASASWTQTYTVESVMIHGHQYRLTQEVMGKMTIENEWLAFEIPDLEIFVSGEDDGALVRELNSEFEDLFEDFVQADDSTLSPRGIRVKTQLKALLGLT